MQLYQLPHRVQSTNTTIATLAKVQLWWQGLTMVQKRQSVVFVSEGGRCKPCFVVTFYYM